MKKWRAYFSDALSKKSIREQFKPGSALSKMFMFSFVAAITLGILYQFVSSYITGTRASTESITITVSPSKDQLAIGEEFTFNILLSAPAGKTVSQLELRAKVPTAENAVQYVSGGYQSSPVSGGDGKYFDTEVLQEYSGTTEQTLRLVLSSRKPEAELANQVILKLKFKAIANGTAKFSLYADQMEIVGPAGAGTEPISYSVASASKTEATVRVGQTTGPSATPPPGCRYEQVQCVQAPCDSILKCPESGTPVPSAKPPTPTPTITIAPAPSCRSNGTANGSMARCNHEEMYLSINNRVEEGTV